MSTSRTLPPWTIRHKVRTIPTYRPARRSDKNILTEEAMIRLYHYRNNIWTVCVRLVLAEKGLEYEMVHVDLFAGEHLKPEFVALNPYHKVPLLLDGAMAVPE